jgi:hypothetical protein
VEDEEATFHTDSCRIWGITTTDYIIWLHTQKLNLGCGLPHDLATGRYFCGKNQYWGHLHRSVTTICFPLNWNHWKINWNCRSIPTWWRPTSFQSTGSPCSGRQWPPRRPQSNTTGSSLCREYVKIYFLCFKVRDFLHLRRRIAVAVATVMPDIIHGSWTETENRLDGFRIANCAHFEEIEVRD